MMKQNNGNNFGRGVTEHKTREGRKLYFKSFCFEIIRSIGSCEETSNQEGQRSLHTHLHTHSHHWHLHSRGHTTKPGRGYRYEALPGSHTATCGGTHTQVQGADDENTPPPHPRGSLCPSPSLSLSSTVSL